MNKKILIASLVTLASVAATVGVVGNTHKVDAAEKNIYLKPSGKETAGAWFWVHAWNDSSSKDVAMNDSDGDGVYEVAIDESYNKIIFVRANPSNQKIDWNSAWNQSANLSIPTDGNNCWTWGSDWTGATGSWSTYTPPVGYQEHVLTLVGSLPEANWAPTYEGYLLKDGNEDHVYELEIELEEGSYEFKIAKDKAWDTSYGHASASNTYTDTVDVKLSGTENVKLTASGGTYHFTFDFSTKQLTVDYTPAPDYDAEVKSLLNGYYNNGTYTRHTVINLSEAAKVELAKYWHAGSNLLERTTHFDGDSLWMTNEKTEENGTYSYYGTKYDGETPVGVTGGRVELGTKTESVVLSGEGKESMEAYYTTLNDIMNNTAEWSYEDGVYSTEDSDVVKMFLDFTAPCLYDVTEDNANYLAYAGVEVEETVSGLELRLLVSDIDAGKLAVENGVLSTATITYEA